MAAGDPHGAPGDDLVRLLGAQQPRRPRCLPGESSIQTHKHIMLYTYAPVSITGGYPTFMAYPALEVRACARGL
jgi:hypothetical protein